MRTTKQTVVEFLALAVETMPKASYYENADDEEDFGSPWDLLRDFVEDPRDQEMNHIGASIRLQADADGWRDGVYVSV